MPGEQENTGQQQATTEQPGQAEKKESPQVIIPKEVIADLEKQLLSNVSEIVDKKATEKAESAVGKYRQQMAAALGLTPTVSNETILQKFLDNPREVLTALKQETRREVLDEFRKERDREKEQQSAEVEKGRELQRAVVEVLEGRPDIRKNKSARETIDSFYAQASDDLSEKEKVEHAVRKYDLLMEDSGLGKAEERVKAVQTVSSRAGGKGEPPAGKSEKEILVSYRDSRIDRFKKTHGGHYPRSS